MYSRQQSRIMVVPSLIWSFIIVRRISASSESTGTRKNFHQKLSSTNLPTLDFLFPILLLTISTTSPSPPIFFFFLRLVFQATALHGKKPDQSQIVLSEKIELVSSSCIHNILPYVNKKKSQILDSFLYVI